MNQRPKKLLLLIAILLVGLAALLLAAKYVGQQIKDDPDRAPPLVQIRNQAKKLIAQRRDAIVTDSYVGYTLLPNVEQLVQTDDFEFERITDARGFPNSGNWPDSADIVFLGDSLVMAEGVGLDRGLVGLVDQSLADQTVINLGNPGAGLERQFRIYEKYGKDLNPRLVVAVFFVSSDLLNDTHFFDWLDAPQGMTYNEFRLSYSRRNNPRSDKNFLRRLQGHVLYHWAVSVVEPRLWGDFAVEHRATMPDGTELLFNRATVMFASTTFDGNEREFENFRASLTRLVTSVDASETDLLVVLLPSKEELFARGIAQRGESAVAVVTSELVSRGINYLDLYPVLRDSASSGTPYFRRDPHLNDIGNGVVAEAIAQWLEANSSGAGPE